VSWTPQLAVRASMCAAEIVHYRVDRVTKKTRQGFKEVTRNVKHHDASINRMMGRLAKLEEERAELDAYNRLSEVVQAWDARIDSLELSRLNSVTEVGALTLEFLHKFEDMKAQMESTERGNQLQIQQLRERCGALENTSLEATHRIGSLETQVGVPSSLLVC
jgi:chromosome segregation ATPase